MRWLFWGAVFAISYTYFGYALWLWMRCRQRPQQVRTRPFFPFISIVLVVRNEESVLECKLRNLLELTYPADKMEILAVSDGSTDDTNRILSSSAKSSRLRVFLNSQACGKAEGLNKATSLARGDIVVFTDARQRIEANSVRLLLENFADPEIGCASGELMLGDPNSGETSVGMGLYWKFEKWIREMESGSGSVIGATGALYAVRRDLVVAIPPETILDDVFLPMHVLKQGARVVFDSRARAWDLPNQGRRREFSRKVRTLTGNYQLLHLCPWLLQSANPARFEFICHKLLRLVMPFALVAALIACSRLSGTVYRVGLTLQVAFYALSALTLLRTKIGPFARVVDAAFTFVLLNTAAVVAFANFVTGRKATWVR